MGEIERELKDMLRRPTAEQVADDISRQNLLMIELGRALAPKINEALLQLQKSLEVSQEGEK